jgi:hypothetical protein
MKLTSEPPVIYYNNTSDITADFNNSFNGIEINSLDPLMGHLPDGCTVNFTATIGTLENININTLNGLAITKFIGNEVGNAAITAILNNQVLNTSVVVVDNIPPTASANPKGGIFNTDKTVTLLMDENGSIYYTLDGSTPSKSSLLYSDPIIINNSTILKFIAYDLAGNASTVYNEYYEIDNIPPSVNASVPGGYYNSSKTVYLHLSETSGTIYYTLDGSLPTFESDIYTDPLEISSSTILKFLGVDRAGNFSPIYSEDYVIDLDNPVGKNNLSSGYYNSPITVILRLDEPGNIYYTIDGSTPTTSSYLYVNPLVIGVTTNLKFIGVDLAGNYSPIYSENYVIDLINPVVTNNLASGYYNTSKTVNLSLSEPGAIYYTIDGTTPTASSYLYVNPLVIGVGSNLKFLGVDLAGNSSPVYGEDYVIDMVNPTASGDLASGYYNTSKTVILSLSEPGAIYYTTDGTTPTTSSSLYVNPLVIGVTTNLKFIGVDLAGNSSPVRSKLYTIDKVAPLVSYTTPANSGTGFSRTAKIVVKFNDKIKNSTNYTKITVKNLTTGKTVSITMRISTTLLYITTGLKKTANTWYQVTIPAKAIKDLAGNNLAKDYTFKFKTGSA